MPRRQIKRPLRTAERALRSVFSVSSLARDRWSCDLVTPWTRRILPAVQVDPPSALAQESFWRVGSGQWLRKAGSRH